MNGFQMNGRVVGRKNYIYQGAVIVLSLIFQILRSNPLWWSYFS